MWDVYCTGATLQTAALMLGWAQLSSPSTSWVAICGGAVCMNGVVNVVEKAGHVSQAQSWFQIVKATHSDSMYSYSKWWLQEKQLSSLEVVVAGSWYKEAERTLRRLSRPDKGQPSWRWAGKHAAELTDCTWANIWQSWHTTAKLTNCSLTNKSLSRTKNSWADRLQPSSQITI